MAHAAGELARPGALEAAESEPLEQRHGARPRFCAWHSRQFEAEDNVVDGPSPREERVSLRHVRADAKRVGCDPLIEEDLAGSRPVEAGQDPEERALAAAAWADHGDEFAGLRDEVDPVERDERLAFLGVGGA